MRPQYHDQILDYLRDPLFFRDLEVMKDSQEIIKQLCEHYEVFINDMNIVFCGDKSIIHADYLIDDNARHFKHFSGQGILFTSPHNVNETGYVRVNNWIEVRDFFFNN